jgi:O-methyltransferase involved in polyketide biosynthesis
VAPTYRYAEVVASLPPGIEIVFDYAIAPATLGEEDRARHDDAAGVVATRGEPWLTYFEPATLGPELRAIGLKQVEDLGPMSSTSGTSRTGTDGLRLPALARLAKAGR